MKPELRDEKILNGMGHAIYPYVIRCTFSGYSMSATVTCHIVKDGKSLCGRDARNWSSRYQYFNVKTDCKKCARAAGLKEKQKEESKLIEA